MEFSLLFGGIQGLVICRHVYLKDLREINVQVPDIMTLISQVIFVVCICKSFCGNCSFDK